MKYFLYSLLIPVLFLAMPVYADTYTVTTTADELDSISDCTDNPIDCSLREAIAAANDSEGDDTITLPAGIYTLSIPDSSGHEDDNTSGDLDITDQTGTITIQGEDAETTIIDGADVFRVFDVLTDTSFEIDAVTIQNGNSLDGEYQNARAAGAIRITSATAVISNCIIKNNTASFAGGAIRASNSSSNTTITDCYIHSNTLENDTIGNGYGGAIGNSGIMVINRSVIANNTNIDDNTVYGSAINNGSGADMTLMNSYVVNNHGGSDANEYVYGAIRNVSTMSVINSVIANNTAIGSIVAWPGFYTSSSSTTFQNSIFSNNTDQDTNEINCELNDVTPSSGYNIDSGTTCNLSEETDQTDTDPLLAEAGLEDNGGAFPTIALQASSPAIDALPQESCLDNESEPLSSDARGMTRPENDACDIGPYEVDQTDPEITVSNLDTVVECAVESWSSDNASITITDNFATELEVTVSGTVSTDTVGSYDITYTSTADYDGNTDSQIVTVGVEDTTYPEITVTGENSIDVAVGDTYSDAGAFATDACDGALAVTTSGTVDTSIAGTYTLTYTATDNVNNSTQATRTIVVSGDGEGGNNPETGDGDGSGATEETLGAVTALTRLANNEVTVSYAEGGTKTFNLFSGSAKAKVKLHTNGDVLIAISKKKIRTFDAYTGERIAQKKLFKNKQKYTKFKKYNVYNASNNDSANSVIVLARTKKKQYKKVKMRHLIVKNDGTLSKKNVVNVTLDTKVKKFKNISLKRNKKNGKNFRVTLTKKGKKMSDYKYRITKKKKNLKQV